jgi:excisionase family DNA binding protein
MSNTTDQYYTVRQIADRLHVGESLVTRLLRTGTMHGMRTGTAGGWRVSRAEFDRWLDNTHGGNEQHRDAAV